MLAVYEKRLTTTPTRLALLVGILLAAVACVTTLALDPVTVWFEDQLWPISAAAIAGNWSIDYARCFKNFDHFDNQVITASGAFVSAIVATAQTAWRGDVQAALYRTLTFALVTATPSTILCYLIALSREEIIDTRSHIEGMRLLRGKPGLDHLRHVMAKESGRAKPRLIIAPDFMISKLRELRGILVAGAIGSGKTRICLFIIDAVLDMIRQAPERRFRLLIHDTTGEILQGLPLQDNEFAALHGARAGGWAWAQGRDVLTMTDAEAVGDAMAPKTQEGIWGAGAAVFLAAAQIKCQHDLGTAWGIPEFYDTLLEDPIVLKSIYEKIYPIGAALIEIDPSTGGLSKTTVSFLLTFRAAVLRFLRPLAENWRDVPYEKKFSFIEWLEDCNPNQPLVVVLQRSGKYPELSAAWIGAVIDTIAGHANDESFPNSQDRRVFLALEELATLGRLRNLNALLDTGRNKGIGIICASIQEIEQLKIHYGELEARTILKRFRTKIICQQVLDDETDAFSKAFIGKKTVVSVTESQTITKDKDRRSTTTSQNEQHSDVPSVRGERLAHDLGVFGNRVRAIVAGAEDPVQLEWPVTIWPRRRR
jgi:hypothetical protein